MNRLMTYEQWLELFKRQLRKYIKHKKMPLSSEAQVNLEKYKQREVEAKNKANISFEIRQNKDDLLLRG